MSLFILGFDSRKEVRRDVGKGMVDSDSHLMAKFKSGDIAAFEELMKKYKKSVINVIYGFIGDRDEAEDLALEVFLKVYKSGKNFKGKAKFSTWLYKIVTNLCLNYNRQKRRFPSVSLDRAITNKEGHFELQILADDNFRPDLILQRKERDSIIRRAVYSLPGKQRMAVILQRFEDLSCKEISRVMGCSLSAVESLLHRAKQSLRKKLSPYFQKK